MKRLLYVLLPLIFWLGVWQIGSVLVSLTAGTRGGELLRPGPAVVLEVLVRLIGTAAFWRSVFATLGRVLVGLLAGVVLGSVLAGLTCAFSWFDVLVSPFICVVRAAPVASFILLVLLWVGRDRVPAVISALMVLPVVWGNLARGIRETDPRLLELARAYRFSSWKVLVLIYLPSLRPYFLSGLTTSIGLAWKSGVAAEVLCLPKRAIGSRIYNTKLYLEVPELFAWTAVTVALSLALEYFLRRGVGRFGKGAVP